jgi:hypothetical protein
MLLPDIAGDRSSPGQSRRRTQARFVEREGIPGWPVKSNLTGRQYDRAGAQVLDHTFVVRCNNHDFCAFYRHLNSFAGFAGKAGIARADDFVDQQDVRAVVLTMDGSASRRPVRRNWPRSSFP